MQVGSTNKSVLIPGEPFAGRTEREEVRVRARYLPCPSSSSSALGPWSPRSSPSAASSWRPVEASSHSCLPPLPQWGPQQGRESGPCPFSSGPCGWELLWITDLTRMDIWINPTNHKLDVALCKQEQKLLMTSILLSKLVHSGQRSTPDHYTHLHSEQRMCLLMWTEHLGIHCKA